MKDKRRHIVIAIPCYTGQLHMATAKSLIFDILQMAQKGWSVSILEQIGNGDISDCRAILMQQALDIPSMTHVVMVDTDVCWQANGIAKLVNHNVDFVCGLYPKRSDPLTFQFRSALEEGAGALAMDNGLVEVWGVPAGFICLTRTMIERMIEAFPETEFKVEAKGCPGGKAYGLFDSYRVEGTNEKLGEDYSFCARWRKIGGKVWIDPNITMGHIGLKTFSGELGEVMACNQAKEQAA